MVDEKGVSQNGSDRYPKPNRVGGKLFLQGLITPKELSRALQQQSTMLEHKPIGKIILELVFESHGEKRAMKVKKALEDILNPGDSQVPHHVNRTLTSSECELLDIAANGGCPEEARRCIVQFGANPNVRSLHPSGMTPLLKACSLGFTDLALAILELGADVNMVDKTEHWSPLMHTVHTRNLALLRHLLKKRPNFRQLNKQREDVLTIFLESTERNENDKQLDALVVLELLKRFGKSMRENEINRIAICFENQEIVCRYLQNNHTPKLIAKKNVYYRLKDFLNTIIS